MDGWTSDIYKERKKQGARWIDPIKELELYMEAKCKLTSCWIRDVMVQKWLHRGREKRALYIYIYIYKGDKKKMVKELRIKKRQQPDGELTKYKGCLES